MKLLMTASHFHRSADHNGLALTVVVHPVAHRLRQSGAVDGKQNYHRDEGRHGKHVSFHCESLSPCRNKHPATLGVNPYGGASA